MTMKYQRFLRPGFTPFDPLELFDTPDIPKVLGEIKRVLKPGGRLGVVSMSKEGYEDSLFLKFYEWLHKQPITLDNFFGIVSPFLFSS